MNRCHVIRHALDMWLIIVNAWSPQNGHLNLAYSCLQELILAADAREAKLLAMTQDAGKHVGSVMQMMKSTRHSLEQKIYASQGAFSAVTAELDRPTRQVPSIMLIILY